MPVTQGNTTDRAAWFADEVEKMLPRLLGTALRLTRNESDAQDLVADTVARAWIGLNDLESEAAFRGWIFRILTNCFRSSWRAEQSAGSAEPYEEEEGEVTFSLFERLHQPFLLWWHNPEREFLNRLLREGIEQAIDALPDSSRLVIVLADLQGVSYREIAEILGVPIGTVRSRLARARSRLQKALWEHAVDAGLRDRAQPGEEQP